MVHRIYVEKKKNFQVEANGILHELRDMLGIKGVSNIRVVNRYDTEGITAQLFDMCVGTVFSEPQLDNVYKTLDEAVQSGANLGECKIFATEYLPGQFDMRAASAAQCIQLISCGELPNVASARVFLIYGDVNSEELEQIKAYTINPVEARVASLEERTTLKADYELPTTVKTLDGFIDMGEEALKEFLAQQGLAMDLDDIKFCKDYFKSEKRNPTITEIKMIDTYWSDHCRHTTFGTIISDVTIEDETVKAAYDRYLNMRKEVHGERISKKPVCLMDMGTIGGKYLKKQGKLKHLDESDEINACSVEIDVEVDGKKEDWLLLFKNETHNHPTEIEPFGGAATCIGGAIRDPLANRGYVYQAMRVTGAGNPLVPISETMPGKLPQRKIVQTAAHGYSSYGNQIGLATGLVDEIYHEGYIAKRMEIGAVMGAVPQKAVRREVPLAGDVVILLGGKTGRDGCGGATGSSKAHGQDSLSSCGAEVQKGNAPEERKLQRLFRTEEATLLIKKCNDFGAGGVSVAIGELADGLCIDLDKVPKKYDGLDGTELAISESQERMAVVVSAADAEKFIKLANAENLQATIVAQITATNRLVMTWQGNVICDISRDFLNSNGAEKYIKAHVLNMNSAEKPCLENVLSNYGDDVLPFSKKPQSALGKGRGNKTTSDSESEKVHTSLADKLEMLMANLNVCSKKGLTEHFDGSIGAASVLMPFGGENQLTPTQAMVAKIPVLKGETSTCSAMAYGYNPVVSENNMYVGAYLAVLESLSKIVAAGFSVQNSYLTFQEYFERLRTEPTRWGKPVASLLGALDAQVDFGVAAIGGKDSMSGSFEQLDVPPTLVSFAVAHGDVKNVISPEFKSDNSNVVLVSSKAENNLLPNAQSQLKLFDTVHNLIKSSKIISAWAPVAGGVAEGLVKMCLGNKIGFKCSEKIEKQQIFAPCYGGFILELAENYDVKTIETEICSGNAGACFTHLGTTVKGYTFTASGETVDLNSVQKAYEQKLAPVMPYYELDIDASASIKAEGKGESEECKNNVETLTFEMKGARKTYKGPAIQNANTFAKPRVLIPVFPGTNCEYDSARIMEKAGAVPDVFVINNMTPQNVAESVQAMREKIENSQIIFLPGGFSGADEPEGSAKLIAAFFRNPEITNAVHTMLNVRDGLMLGICNGFQALIKLGLVPFGKIVETDENCPTLTFNTIGRHQSMLVRTRIVSNASPWLSGTKVGDVHTVAISHGEGRFVASNSMLEKLVNNGQIATQYVNLNGDATMDLRFNPNGSVLAIEGITSEDGRVFGKMGHSERCADYLYKNVPGNKFEPIFTSGVNYFK